MAHFPRPPLKVNDSTELVNVLRSDGSPCCPLHSTIATLFSYLWFAERSISRPAFLTFINGSQYPRCCHDRFHQEVKRSLLFLDVWSEPG